MIDALEFVYCSFFGLRHISKNPSRQNFLTKGRVALVDKIAFVVTKFSRI